MGSNSGNEKKSDMEHFPFNRSYVMQTQISHGSKADIGHPDGKQENQTNIKNLTKKILV